MTSLSYLCVVKPKNSNFPNFNWINLKFGFGVDFRALISKFNFIWESGHLTTSVFYHPLFSPDFIILFQIWVQVDKPLKLSAKEKFFENPFCVSGCNGNCQIIYNCT